MASAPRKRRQFANQDVAGSVDAREAPNEHAELCADWLLQIKMAEQRNEKWEKRCEQIIKRYRNEHSEANTETRRMNVLWSNVETLEPCVYGREPVPIAERRFLDRDDTGRVASQILERALRYEMHFCGYNDAVKQAVKDYLLVGRGVVWNRYKPIIGQASSLTDMGDDELTDREGMPVAEPSDETPHFEEDEHNDSGEPTEVAPSEKLLSASLEVDYVHWKDFLHSKARFWKENTWVARRLYPSRKDLIDDFGDEIGKAVPLEMSPEMSKSGRGSQRSQQAPDSLKKAIVYEIWDRSTRMVYTIAKGFARFLEEPREDPLNLENFFPCVMPLFATMTNDTLEPVPDYIEYQDQALEIDQLSNRIDLLIKALKVVGVYDAGNKQLARLLDEGHENKMIPVPNWAAFGEKGGLAGAVSFLPIKEIGEVLAQLFAARDKIKADLFEITGLSDIIRGQADPRETAKAVSTKGKWGTLRLQARQANVARFCKDIIVQMGEIVSEHFPAETLINVSGAMYDEGIGGAEPTEPKQPDSPMMGHNGGPPMGMPPGAPQMAPPQGLPGGVMQPPPHAPMLAAGPPALPGMPLHAGAPGAVPPPDPMMQYQMELAKYQQDMAAHQAEKMGLIGKAIELLRQDKLRGFRIDIETDSTIQADANEDKQARTEFITGVTKFMEEGFKIGQQVPEAVPVLGKMLLFGVRGFRAGRDLESAIEEFVETMEKDAKAKASAPPPPNPELQKEMLDLQTAQEKSKAEVMKAQIDAQASAEDNQREMATKQLDAQIAQHQAAMDLEKMRQESEMRKAEYEARMAELAMKMQMMQQSHAQELQRSATEHQQHLEKLAAQPKPEANGALQ